jgi:DNA-binding PadR family transcriptional regulator
MTSDELHDEMPRVLRGWHDRFHETRGRSGRRGREHGRDHHRRGHRRGERARRGDVRAAVLLALEESPMHGYQLIQEIDERSGGVWRPSPGAIYPALALLEDEGLVTIAVDNGRKMASLTDAGRGYIDENRDSLGDPFTVEGPNPAAAEIADLVRDLMIAAKVLARSANDEQLARIRDLLAQTRRDFYRILADEPA